MPGIVYSYVYNNNIIISYGALALNSARRRFVSVVNRALASRETRAESARMRSNVVGFN